jgi:hypothetical protein
MMDASFCPCGLLVSAYPRAPSVTSCSLLPILRHVLDYVCLVFLLTMWTFGPVQHCFRVYSFHSGVSLHPWPPPLALFPSGVLGWSGEDPFIDGLPNHAEMWMDLRERKACPSFLHSNCHPLAVQYLVRDVYVGRILGKGVLLLTNRGLFHLRGPNLRLR